VANPNNLWLLHCLGKTYGGRPSAFVGVEDGWAAYQLDLAALVVGGEVEGRIAQADGKMTVEKALRAWAAERKAARREPSPGPSPAGMGDESRFRDVTPYIEGKVAIPPDGIW
jgi:hypothetical protein